MSGPIAIDPRLLGTRARAQNASARHIFKPLKRWRSFLLADAVGTGKSYIALSLAFGFFKRRMNRPFRLVVLAGPTELSDSWIQKLAGSAGTGPAIGHIARTAERGSFIDLYWKTSPVPDFVVYQLRHRRDIHGLAEHLDETQKISKVLRPGRKSHAGRVEVLVTSPRFLLELTRRGREKYWRRWIRNSDFVIADEVFAAKNPDTGYGRLLRDFHLDIWPRTRPPLLGLSATLLSRDLPDAEAVLNMALAWGRQTGQRQLLGSNLKNQIDSFRTALRTGIRQPSRAAVVSYNQVTEKLEQSLKVILVRAQPKRRRKLKFWSSGHDARPDDPGIVLGSFPAADVNKDVLTPLRLEASKAPKAAENLSWFLLRDPYKVDGPVSARNYKSWTSVTESPALGDKGPVVHPKLTSLGHWIERYYEDAERSWLEGGKVAFKFKLVVYVHHVKTATHLNPHAVKRFGRALQQNIAARIRRSCLKFARDLPSLFRNGDLHHPSNAIESALLRSGWSIQELWRRNSTLLLAALLNARKSKNALRSFKRTLHGGPVKERQDYGLLLLQNSSALREMLFESEKRITAYDKGRSKKAKRLSTALLDLRYLPTELRNELRLALKITKKEFSQLAFSKHSKPPPKIRALALAARTTLDGDPKWRRLVRRANIAPAKTLDRLLRRASALDGEHREPAIAAVLTGGDTQTRNFVIRRFCEPGNPLILILTHVCQVGIDLHPYCWDVVHYSPAWTPHELEQKTGRIDRPRLEDSLAKLDMGERQSRHDIRIHHLIWPFTYDERILSRLNVRAMYAERLLGSKDTHDASDARANALARFRPLHIEPRRP